MNFNNKFIKSLLKIILLVAILFIFKAQPVHAHGVIYEVKPLDENKIRITLKWSKPTEEKGISISYYSLKNGKTLTIGYRLNNKAGKTAQLDYDLTGAITPIRIIVGVEGDINYSPFKDIKNTEAEEYIRHLHDLGLTDGDGKGMFKPDKKLTRAEFAVLMVKALKLDETVENTYGFTDVNKHGAKKYLLTAVKNGILKGYDDKTLRPDKTITLAEVSEIIYKKFSFKTVKNGTYTKLKTNKWYSKYVKRMFDTGILSPNDSVYKSFNEESSISKANFATMLSRALSTY